jgi:S1-C subfamily serine protease
MRRALPLTGILIVVFSLLASPVASAASPDADATARAKAALALAQAKVGLGTAAADPKDACVRVSWKQWSASGTCVVSSGGRSLIVTNNHLFSETHDANGQFVLGAYPLPATVTVVVGGAEHKAVAVGGDTDADLAFVVVDATIPFAPLAASDTTEGTLVQHYGIGSGGGRGRVLAWIRHQQAKHRFAASYTSESGDSGAGVFDPSGSVVAVHCGRHDDTAHGDARGTPVSAVRERITALTIWPPK